MDNIVALHQELKEKSYRHGPYQAFKINDPKPRDIHKASVRDRLLHHAVHRILYPYFDRRFIYQSCSCRLGNGTHLAIHCFRNFSRKVSLNNTRTCWILKGDIRKFFANIDHVILKDILARYIDDADTLWLLNQVLDSFHTQHKVGVGLPLGNLTSQLLVNIYMNEFDQFVKRELRVKYYIRYADDFVLLSEDREYLVNLIPRLAEFLGARLMLSLHPDKLFLKTLALGVDFLGWVQFPHYRVLRTSTKQRMFKKLDRRNKAVSIISYLGLLSHGNTYKLRQGIVEKFKK